MRLRKPGSKPSEASNSGGSGELLRTLGAILQELLAIAREMLRIPAGLYMRAAERAGAATLAAWRFTWPILVALERLAVRGFRVAEREVTPLRAALAVAAVAAAALGGSQFADYRSVAIGTADYVGVQAVVDPPPVDTATAGSAHAWIGLPLGITGLVAVAACWRGSRRTAWLLALIGLIVVVVSLAVDVPKGLDEGDAAVAYEGASASLLGGFWVQLACGALLIALAPLIAVLLGRGDGSPAPARDRRVPFARVPASEAGG